MKNFDLTLKDAETIKFYCGLNHLDIGVGDIDVVAGGIKWVLKKRNYKIVHPDSFNQELTETIEKYISNQGGESCDKAQCCGQCGKGIIAQGLSQEITQLLKERGSYC